MTTGYLVDIDWAIHYLNGHPEIVEKLQLLKKDGLRLSIVSLAELYEGVYYSRNPEESEAKLNDFLRGTSVIGIDEEICKVFGKERGRLRKTKKVVGDFDLLIGAIALHHNLTVLTNNRRLFELIEGITFESL